MELFIFGAVIGVLFILLLALIFAEIEEYSKKKDIEAIKLVIKETIGFMKENSDFPGAIIKATKNSNLTNILDDCKKFHGYFPYNEASNTYFNNGAFLLALIDEYSYENVSLWLEWCWDQMHWDKPFNYIWEQLFKTTTKITKGEN